MSHNSFSPISTVNEASLTETGAFLTRDRSSQVLLLVKTTLSHTYPLHFVGKQKKKVKKKKEQSTPNGSPGGGA